VAGLVDKPVTIKNIEYSIVERAWEEGWITPRIPQSRSGMSVSVVGSGPSGEFFSLSLVSHDGWPGRVFLGFFLMMDGQGGGGS
jgi:NADPH-dependent glutamate synthase beta subunit-like oxidoreductase